jgi:hypothetical protein
MEDPWHRGTTEIQSLSNVHGKEIRRCAGGHHKRFQINFPDLAKGKLSSLIRPLYRFLILHGSSFFLAKDNNGVSSSSLGLVQSLVRSLN